MSTTTVKESKLADYATLLLRIGLGIGFLSAVADRLGLWGAFGQPNVEWGNFSRFLEYTHTLNWYLPVGMVMPLGIIATGAEIFLGLLLIVGWHTRAAALLPVLVLLGFVLVIQEILERHICWIPVKLVTDTFTDDVLF